MKPAKLIRPFRIDQPGRIKIHAEPRIRTGGLAIWAGFVPAAAVAPPLAPVLWCAILFALAAVAAISLLDDWRGVHPAVRLARQVDHGVGRQWRPVQLP